MNYLMFSFIYDPSFCSVNVDTVSIKAYLEDSSKVSTVLTINVVYHWDNERGGRHEVILRGAIRLADKQIVPRKKVRLDTPAPTLHTSSSQCLTSTKDAKEMRRKSLGTLIFCKAFSKYLTILPNQTLRSPALGDR